HAETAAAVRGLPLVAARALPDERPGAAPLGLRFMQQFPAVIVGEDADSVQVLLADPQDPYVLDAVRLASGRDVRPAVALRSEVDDLIERWHGQGRDRKSVV